MGISSRSFLVMMTGLLFCHMAHALDPFENNSPLATPVITVDQESDCPGCGPGGETREPDSSLIEAHPGQTCPAGQIWNGGGASGRCICANGGSPPACGGMEERPGNRPGSNPPPAPPACRGQVIQLVNQCRHAGSAASSSCDQGRITGIANQAYGQKQQLLSQSQNTNVACQSIAQAMLNAGNQINGIVPSCQAAVSQCASACGQVISAASSCQDSTARQAASSVQGLAQSCQGGPLAQRPQQIQKNAGDLLAEANNKNSCAAQSASTETQNSSSGSSNGNLKQDATIYEYREGQQNPYNTKASRPNLTPHGDEFQNPGSTNEGYSPPTEVSQNDYKGNRIEINPSPVSSSSGQSNSYDGTGSMGLASLPPTPTTTPDKASDLVSSNGSPKSNSSGSTGEYTSGRRGGGPRAYRLPRGSRSNGNASLGYGNQNSMASASKSLTPDLSRFLPNRRIAGRAGLLDSGCRILDPKSAGACAIPHGPPKDLFGAIKDRTEKMRQNLPPHDYFFHEE